MNLNENIKHKLVDYTDSQLISFVKEQESETIESDSELRKIVEECLPQTSMSFINKVIFFNHSLLQVFAERLLNKVQICNSLPKTYEKVKEMVLAASN